MISAVILTKNEDNNIVNCLKTLEWCSEIVVIDDYSTDNTINEIRSLKNSRIKIYQRYLSGDFSKQRNFGLSKAKHNWVLFIDADERISDSLQYEILTKINNSLENISGYYLRRRDKIWGKVLRFGESANYKLLRLARKDRGKWIGKVHETWEIEGKKMAMKNILLHTPHPTLENFLKEINIYTDIRAEELYNQGIKSNITSVILYPTLKFCHNYLFKLGFLDGIRGLMSAIIMSFHSFLVRGKLWKLRDDRSAK